jgi:hypothetical protein
VTPLSYPKLEAVLEVRLGNAAWFLLASWHMRGEVLVAARFSVAATVGVLVLGPGVSSAVEHGPGIRLGMELGATSLPASYQLAASAPGAAMSVRLHRRDESIDLGGRVDVGWTVAFPRKIALFPHLGLAYTPLRTSHHHLSTASNQYVLTAERRWMSLGVAPEIQFARRRVILAPEIGVAWANSQATLEGGGLSASSDASWRKLWVRVAAGGRWPLGASLAGRALLAGELSVPTYLDDPAAFRAVLAIFIETDGSQW